MRINGYAYTAEMEDLKFHPKIFKFLKRIQKRESKLYGYLSYELCNHLFWKIWNSLHYHYKEFIFDNMVKNMSLKEIRDERNFRINYFDKKKILEEIDFEISHLIKTERLFFRNN